MSVDIEDRGEIVVVALNRPEARNALDRATSEALREAFLAFRADRSKRVAVLAGRGQDFCAGVDLKEDAGRGRVIHGGITRDFECHKPIVVALQGNVLGGGLELALCADLRVADETARLGSPEVRWGLMQGAGATQRLPRAVPLAVALEMLLTGDPVDAHRAERIGLVNRVVPAGEALPGALALAERLAERAPLALARAKEAAHRGLDVALADGLRLEELLSRLLAGTEDLVEGRRAFLERRPPRFEGR